ncbi:MAG: hypothetical protein FWE09_00350 [Treponema sp.]|nr:hypothetical protein [Treponema sp.]
MDDAMLQEMLDEIDAMTSEEYWELFNESQKLPYAPVVLEEYWRSLGNEPDEGADLFWMGVGAIGQLFPEPLPPNGFRARDRPGRASQGRFGRRGTPFGRL